MLQAIRDNAQGMIIWVIVGLIIITFALFGLSGYLSGSAKVNVATINGVEISETEFRRAYQNYKQKMQRLMGPNFRPEFFTPERMSKDAINELVTQELITQVLDESGFRAAPQQVVNQLQRTDAFREQDGKFSSAIYNQLIAQQGMNSELYEEKIGRDISSQQFYNGLVQSAFTTDYEVKAYDRLERQQRDIGYVVLSKNNFLLDAKASEVDIRAYYDVNGAEFLTPEQVSVDYIEFNIVQIAKQVEIEDEAMRLYYKENKGNYTTTPEERQARHILIKTDKDVDDATAKAKAQDLYQRIKKGESFETLAKKFSQDPGSAKQGGDLGFFGKGVMDKAFEKAAFKLKKGKVSEPVKSRFGYHLIKLEAIRGGGAKKYAEVRDAIERDLQLEQAEQTFFADVEKLSNLSYENPDSLGPVAEELGLEIKHSKLFIKGRAQGVLSNPKVRKVVFSDEVIKERKNSDLIEISDTHLVVLRVKEHKPSSQRSLEAVRNIISARLRHEAARKRAEKSAKEVLDRLRKGEAPWKVVESVKQAKWERPGFIARQPGKDKQIFHENIRTGAFRIPRPTEEKPAFDVVEIPGGNAAVVGVYAVRVAEADEKDKTKEALDSRRNKLAKMHGSSAYGNLVQYYRKAADITINLPTDN